MAEFFAARGVAAYLVGGVVRDTLLGRATQDIDVAVAADAQSVSLDLASYLGGRAVPLDESRGIARVVVGAGREALYVDLSSIHGGIAEDLGRRDFTLDAMAVPLREAVGRGWGENLIDSHGGLLDLRAGVIRALAPSVFQADPARLLRAPRLAAQLRFTIAEETADLIRRDARLVLVVAPERVRDELLKLLAEPGVAASLRRLDDLGLLCRVIPELAAAKDVTQPREHHWDVFNHLVETAGQVERVVGGQPGDGELLDDAASENMSGSVENFPDGRVQRGFHPLWRGSGGVPQIATRGRVGGTRASDSEDVNRANMPLDGRWAEEVSDGHARLPLLKLAGLLHDIAKPATKTVEPSGRIRFLGHHTQGALVAAEILRRLRFSGRGVELVRRMVEHHLRPSQMAQGGQLPTPRAIYRYYRDLGDAAIDTLYLNMADFLAARGPEMQRDEWEEHRRVVSHILREGLQRLAPGSLAHLIDGEDIMNAFHLSSGPKVGLLLALVREAQAAGEVATREEAMALVKAHLGSGGNGA